MHTLCLVNLRLFPSTQLISLSDFLDKSLLPMVFLYLQTNTVKIVTLQPSVDTYIPLYINKKVTCKNMSLNHSTFGILFHKLFFTVKLIVLHCLYPLWHVYIQYRKRKKPLQCRFRHILFDSLFYHFTEFQKF